MAAKKQTWTAQTAGEGPTLWEIALKATDSERQVFLNAWKFFLLSIDSSCRCNTSDLLTTPVFLLQFS